MYKYTIHPSWKHYFKHRYYAGCPHYKNIPYNVFIEAGWPNTYITKYETIHYLPATEFYSRTPLREVPVRGYLIPAKFFKEELLK